MREIKFRVWFKNWSGEGKGGFYKASEDHFTWVMTLDGRIGTPVEGYDRGSGDIEIEKDEYIINQYTGLKDKNGKDIYEGDVVKWGHLSEWTKENPVRIAVVEFNPDIQFRCLNMNRTFQFGSFAYQRTEEALEVIGNIYEDTELLK